MEFIWGVCNSTIWLNIGECYWTVNLSVEYQADVMPALVSPQELVHNCLKFLEEVRRLPADATASRPCGNRAMQAAHRNRLKERQR